MLYGHDNFNKKNNKKQILTISHSCFIFDWSVNDKMIYKPTPFRPLSKEQSLTTPTQCAVQN